MNDETAVTMKAIRYHKHGGPEVLQYEDVPRPVPAEGEVLVRVHAVGVNPGDWQIRSGLAGDAFGLPFIPGWDLSGVVESVGPNATGYRQGDAVYGMTSNSAACAEYAVVPATQLARKPRSIDHLHAAGVPMSAFTAWHALFGQAHLERGQTVLINGTSGGVGHFAVQLAKRTGAYVIGVASGRNERFVRELGVDRFVDYTTTPLDTIGRQADLVVDTVGGERGDHLLDALKPGGVLVPVAWGQYDADRASTLSVTVRDVQLLRIHTRHLNEIGRLIDAGQLRVCIDTVLPLRDARLAHERSESRRACGKIVLQVVD